MSAVHPSHNLSKKTPQPLILASTSKYRKELLGRLRIDFQTISPEVDEAPLKNETPEQIALRLAKAKALAIAKSHPEAWVIGSDQVVDLHGAAMGKPGDHDTAMAQLQLLRGETVKFHTAVCVAKGEQSNTLNVITEVTFRTLKDSVLEAYLLAETPYDCAGSAKSEGLGICLLERVHSDDPTALIGLPLIAVCTLLREAGFQIPG
ncbi:septum formation protein Maf [Polynucleobacter sp. MWH-Spelu-300-X4]|jgi:septum formation protein|uniref:Maf family nucleotide pyrophosphatase n=1 Tax=Polynucleobacter sp. MWH-Spelu-300-X4 TaxID=2689109 RepID=UPI001BFE219B|nr:Maf family nucleotide pyrophosphatase [Polynucleobacter sp. MWH-Spelu-300-X4]QWD80277.1 septum formation protein Maf [Polynucleobacter sp. MWH-Spelu-300-X4]